MALGSLPEVLNRGRDIDDNKIIMKVVIVIISVGLF